jgi:hypothetical protein
MPHSMSQEDKAREHIRYRAHLQPVKPLTAETRTVCGEVQETLADPTSQIAALSFVSLSITLYLQGLKRRNLMFLVY